MNVLADTICCAIFGLCLPTGQLDESIFWANLCDPVMS
jgi:hypothetical protein